MFPGPVCAVIVQGIPRSEVSGRILVRVSLFAVLTAAGAYIIIPLPYSPVPLTLQTLFVMLSGAVLGKRGALSSQLIYIMLGASGLPVFAGGGSGIGYLFGPTGGYVAGFALGAYAGGLLSDKGHPFIGMGAVAFIIYSAGLFWLARVTGRTLPESAAIGFLPFLPGDIVKFAAACAIYRRLKQSGVLAG